MNHLHTQSRLCLCFAICIVPVTISSIILVKKNKTHKSIEMRLNAQEVEHQTLPCLVSARGSSYLVLCHSTNNQRAHHPRQSSYTVRDSHEDAGIAWRNVQVIDIKALAEEKIVKSLRHFTFMMFA